MTFQAIPEVIDRFRNRFHRRAASPSGGAIPLYVALSRARSVEGLPFVRPIAVPDVQVDRMFVAFLAWAGSTENLEFEGRTAA